MEDLGKRVKEVLKETEGEANEMGGKRGGWWDEECGKKKKEVRRKLRS